MKTKFVCSLFIPSFLVFWACTGLLLEGQSLTVEITGTVYPPEGMRSLPPATEVSLNNGWGYWQTQLVTNGRFEFSGVAPGRYKLGVRAEGFQSSEQVIEVAPHTGSRYHVGIQLGAWLAGGKTPPAGVPTVPLAALRVPKTARREFDKGRGDYQKRQYESALQHFQAASSICPDWAQPHVAEGLVHMDMKRAGEAEAALRRAVSLDPGWYVPLKHLGYLLLMNGRFQEALEPLDHALRIYPADALTHTYRGEALYQMGRHAEAGQAFKAALGLNQADLHAGYRLGYVLLRLGERKEALAAFETFLREHGDADRGDVAQWVTKLRNAQANDPGASTDKAAAGVP